MREECKNYESRTYPNGETVRKCNLDLAPDAPWRCPDRCNGYERRLADVSWAHGTLISNATPDEPPGLDDGSAAAILDEAILASAITCARHGADPPTRAELSSM